jgi:glycosyltransferase involved in cell wall biosynthesis
MTPRVSVLLAVCNGEPYVREALSSILDQTFRDFEFVIVDDASTDGTVTTIESFGDGRIRLFRNEQNLGQVPSLNRGLREAQGEIVVRMDADDVSTPTRIERQLAVLDGDPHVGLVGSWMTLVDERGRRVGSLRKTLSDYADFVFHTLIMRVWVSHPAAAYRRAPVLAAGLYDEATGPAEDKDMWRKLALARWDARIVPEELVAYRLHDAQLSQTRASYQRSVDEASQERFLTELAPEADDVRALRMLLADDPALWRATFDVDAVDAVLAGAEKRLSLDVEESARLRALVGRWLIGVAAGRPWTSRSRAIASYGLLLLPRETRVPTLLAAAPRAALAPAQAALAAGTRRALESAPSLRRWRAARRLYGKLLGGG